MTAKEHTLMVLVLARQLQITKALLEILNSRGLMETGDVEAFLALVQNQENSPESLFDAALQIYQQVATHLRVETGLQNL